MKIGKRRTGIARYEWWFWQYAQCSGLFTTGMRAQSGGARHLRAATGWQWLGWNFHGQRIERAEAAPTAQSRRAARPSAPYGRRARPRRTPQPRRRVDAARNNNTRARPPRRAPREPATFQVQCSCHVCPPPDLARYVKNKVFVAPASGMRCAGHTRKMK